MRRCAYPLLTVVVALAAAPAALASEPTVHQVAAALKRDPVYVASSESDQVNAAAARRLRRTIRRLDKRRIQVAVVPAASADRVGGIRGFTNAVDQAMPERRGALIGTTGQDFQVVTSYSDVDPTLGALRHAVDAHEHDGLAAQLQTGVEGIADVDPGPGQDINGPPQGGTATTPAGAGASAGGAGQGGSSDVGAIVAIVIGVLVLLPLLGFAIWALVRWRARRRAAAQVEELDLGTTRDELMALGQDIEDLDIDSQMPNANQAGVEEYQQAVMLYDRANRALKDEDPSQVQIAEARRAVEEARAHMRAAKTMLAASPTPPAEPGGETVHPSS